jgi:CHAD domain-containing protein
MNRKSKKHVNLDASDSVSGTIQALLRHNLEFLREWEVLARSWSDIGGVHQTRVAFRRMRSALTVFRPALPKAVAGAWADDMRELGERLGRARDLDVFIEEVLGGIRDKLGLPGGSALEQRLRRARAVAYEDVRAMLDSQEYASFKTDFGAWVDGRMWEQGNLKDKHRMLLEGPVVPFARKVLDRQERRVLEAGTHVDKHDPTQMHKLPIQCKKLRYAAEFFFPFFIGMAEFIGHMKGLQDLLGVMNDVAVMPGLLDEVLAGEKDPQVLQYAGGIVGWRTCYYHELLYDFERRWEELVEAKHPWWRTGAADKQQAEEGAP